MPQRVTGNVQVDVRLFRPPVAPGSEVWVWSRFTGHERFEKATSIDVLRVQTTVQVERYPRCVLKRRGERTLVQRHGNAGPR